MKKSWIVNIKGAAESTAWETSVVRSSNNHGMRSYGWFDDNKLLVSHNGGPCSWPICKIVWDRQVQIAEDLCCELNAKESP